MHKLGFFGIVNSYELAKELALYSRGQKDIGDYAFEKLPKPKELLVNDRFCESLAPPNLMNFI
jgi:hypothetical protein